MYCMFALKKGQLEARFPGKVLEVSVQLERSKEEEELSLRKEFGEVGAVTMTCICVGEELRAVAVEEEALT